MGQDVVTAVDLVADINVPGLQCLSVFLRQSDRVGLAVVNDDGCIDASSDADDGGTKSHDVRSVLLQLVLDGGVLFLVHWIGLS